MKIENTSFEVVDWRTVPATRFAGETGAAFWRSKQAGDIRVRMVEYSPGYLADHWCKKGHILLVLEGTLVTELADGRQFTMTPGMSYQVAEDVAPHRSRTETGVKLFIVD